MNYRRRWLVLAILLLSPVANAPGSQYLHADEWPVARGASREPLPYKYDAKVLATIPKQVLDDSTACILYAGTTHMIEPDGAVEMITHEITRLNSRKGIDKLGEYRAITYDPSYEKLTLNEARIIKADGRIVAIEPKHLQLRDLATDFQVYDQDKQLIISFPNLEVGDAYEVKWTVRGRNKEFDGNFFARYTFGDDNLPVLLDEFRVRVPKNKSLKYATVNGDVNLVITESNGEKFHHWSTKNRNELPKDEERPSREELRLQVMVSTFPSWDEVGRWKQKLRKECWTCSQELREIVEKVTRDHKAPIDKAKALTYWVRRNVRYLSRGPGGAGYTPHMPHQVVNNLYGDCKDQAQLLAVMLREIGLPVWLVTLGTLDDGQILPEVPSPWGSHAILLTKIDGKDYWIDTTVSLAAWDFLPRSDRNRQTYITQEDKLTLVKTPPFTYKDYRIEQTTHVNIQPDGTSMCKRQSTYFHSAAWTRRDRWLEVPPGERRRTMIAELQDANAKTKLLSLKIDDRGLRDFDRPVSAELEFEIPKHFTGDSTREGSLSDSPVWTWFVGYNLDLERRLPYVLPTQFESTHRFIVRLPLAYRLESMPEDKEIRGKWGSFTLKVTPDKDDPRRFEMVSHMRLEQTRVEKEDFARFQQFQDDVNRAYRIWITLRPSVEIADAPKLEKHLEEKKYADSQTAKILAKLYLDFERGDDARRVLAKAAPLALDDKGLWELRVQATTNIDDEERLYREMVKHFPKDPKYGVALGAACVRKGAHDEAKRILTPLAEHSMAAVRAASLYQLAQNEYRQKNSAQAIKHLQQALVTDSGSLATIEALMFKARVHESLGQIKDAILTLTAAIEADGSARDPLEYIVRLELQADMKDAALDHLRKYTVAAGKDLSSLVKAAELHLTMNRLDDAFELASKARDLGFQAKAQRVLGMIYLAKHDYTQAAFHLERCDLDEKGLAGLIDAHLRLGDLNAAHRRAETIRKMENAGKDLLALEKDVEALVQTRDKLLKRWNPDAEVRAAASSIISRYLCAERGLTMNWVRHEVEKLLDSAIADGLPYAPILALRAGTWLDKGQLRKAIDDADAAIKLQPTEARAHTVRGRARLEQGNVKSALADLRKATALTKSGDATTLHWFAAALMEAGLAKEAIETQRLALLLRPNDPLLQEQLRRMEMSQTKDPPGGADER